MKFRIAIFAASITAALSAASIASAGNTYYLGSANGGVWTAVGGGSSSDAALGGPDTLQARPEDPDGIGLLLPAVQASREASKTEQSRQITVIQDMNH